MQRRTMTIISAGRFAQVSNNYVEHELIQYDSVKYRNNPTEAQWHGRRIVGLPFDTLA